MVKPRLFFYNENSFNYQRVFHGCASRPFYKVREFAYDASLFLFKRDLFFFFSIGVATLFEK